MFLNCGVALCNRLTRATSVSVLSLSLTPKLDTSWGRRGTQATVRTLNMDFTNLKRVMLCASLRHYLALATSFLWGIVRLPLDPHPLPYTAF